MIAMPSLCRRADRTGWMVGLLVLAMLGALMTAPGPGHASDEPEGGYDLPGFGIWGPPYQLRQVPDGMQLVVRASPDRSSPTIGVLRRAALNVLVINCTPEIDALTFEDASLAGKHGLLDTAWCLVNHGELEGYVPGIYLDPLVSQ